MVSKNMNKCKRHPFSRLVHYILRSKQKLLSAHASGRRLRGRTWTLRRPTPPRATRLGVCLAGPPSPPFLLQRSSLGPCSSLAVSASRDPLPSWRWPHRVTPSAPLLSVEVKREVKVTPRMFTSLKVLVLHCMQTTPSGSHEDPHRPAAGQGTVRRVPALLTASSGGAGAAGRAQHTPRASRRGWPR